MPETTVHSVSEPAGAPEELSREKACALAQALRDFFSARNGEEIRRAALLLASSSPATARLPMDEDGWREEEYVFNRLFVGPAAVVAPPYASVYLDAEPELMGQSTLHMRNLLYELCLCVPREGQDPEDHLACELEVWLVLMNLLEQHSENQETHGGLRTIINWLTNEHMARWIPQFTQRAREAENLPPATALALTSLTIWLLNSIQRSTHEQL